MLVQPALTTHLLCRPVSIADSTGPRRELQVLCEKGALCYVLIPAFGNRAPETESVSPLNSRLREPCPPQAQACDCLPRPPAQYRGVYAPVFHSSSSTSSSSPRRLAARAWPSRASAPPAWESSSARFSAASTAT